MSGAGFDADEALERIRGALEAALEALRPFEPGAVAARSKAGGDPVTAADLAVNRALHGTLPRAGEGWLSEESADDLERLEHRCVWVVDPLDGTREFVAGIPEWCVSVGLVVDGEPVAGGIASPAAGLLFLGAVGVGLAVNDEPVRPAAERTSLDGATVLASRSEVGRGEWDLYRDGPFHVQPMGSVAYKLARVAAGLADATWTPVPKHEWDVAGGVALLRAAGAAAVVAPGEPPRFNRAKPKLPCLAAAHPPLLAQVEQELERHRQELARRAGER